MIGACVLALSWWRIASMVGLAVVITAVQTSLVLAVFQKHGPLPSAANRRRDVALILLLLNGLLVACAWLGARDYYCGD